jgi:hypothetical protein
MVLLLSLSTTQLVTLDAIWTPCCTVVLLTTPHPTSQAPRSQDGGMGINARSKPCMRITQTFSEILGWAIGAGHSMLLCAAAAAAPRLMPAVYAACNTTYACIHWVAQDAHLLQHMLDNLLTTDACNTMQL